MDEELEDVDEDVDEELEDVEGDEDPEYEEVMEAWREHMQAKTGVRMTEEELKEKWTSQEDVTKKLFKRMMDREKNNPAAFQVKGFVYYTRERRTD